MKQNTKNETPFKYAHAEIRIQVVVIGGPMPYQLDHRGVHPFDRTGVINTVESPAYSPSGFSAISLNYIVIMEDVNVES